MCKAILYIFLSLITASFAVSGSDNSELQAEMYKAAKIGDWVALDKAINKGANPRGRTHLHWAAGEGLLSEVKHLIGQGANIEAKDKSSWTPLILAAFAGKLSTTKVLIDLGANVNYRTENTLYTPLHAATSGTVDVVKVLI